MRRSLSCIHTLSSLFLTPPNSNPSNSWIILRSFSRTSTTISLSTATAALPFAASCYVARPISRVMRMAMEWLCSSVTCSRCDNSFFWSVCLGFLLPFSLFFLFSSSLPRVVDVGSFGTCIISESSPFQLIWSGVVIFFSFLFSLWSTSISILFALLSQN